MNKLTEFLTKPFLEENILNEGARDPGIFKAIFLAGGPGSGKSFVAQKLFGIPEKVNVSKTGLKMVNQDSELELLLKKYFGTTDIDNMPDELFQDLTGVDKKGKEVDYATVSYEEINSRTYKIIFNLQPEFKMARVSQIMRVLKNGLFAHSSGESNTIVPLFIIASGVKVPSPVFHSYIDIQKTKNEYKVIGIQDCLKNDWIDGQVYIQDCERIPVEVQSEKITQDWDLFLNNLQENEEAENESSES